MIVSIFSGFLSNLGNILVMPSNFVLERVFWTIWRSIFDISVGIPEWIVYCHFGQPICFYWRKLQTYLALLHLSPRVLIIPLQALTFRADEFLYVSGLASVRFPAAHEAGLRISDHTLTVQTHLWSCSRSKNPGDKLWDRTDIPLINHSVIEQGLPCFGLFIAWMIFHPLSACRLAASIVTMHCLVFLKKDEAHYVRNELICGYKHQRSPGRNICKVQSVCFLRWALCETSTSDGWIEYFSDIFSYSYIWS